MRSRLLILSCSQQKRPDPGLLAALDRYDGPSFRVLRRYLRQQVHEVLDVWILSAQFGLIPATQPIPDYDRRMTPQRARELRPRVIAQIRELFHCHSYQECFINVGQDYLPALQGYDAQAPSAMMIRLGTGTQGRRLAQLHDWLYGRSPALYDQESSIPSGPLRIRGIEVMLTKEQVLEVARRALRQDHDAAGQYQAWYVLIDDQKVAPKWLVSKLTGLPVSSFVTTEACRLLSQLGFEVRRL